MAESRPFRAWCRFSAVEVFSASVSDLKSQKRIPRSFVVRRAVEEDVPELESFFGGSRRIDERMRRSDICVVTVSKDRIGAAVWLSPGPSDYREDWDDLRCIVRYPAGVCWSYDGVGTKFGAWGSLMMRLPDLLEEDGVEEVFTHIECDNQMSLDSHKSLGYRSIGFVWSFGVFGLVLKIYKTEGNPWRRLPGRIGRLEFCGVLTAPSGLSQSK